MKKIIALLLVGMLLAACGAAAGEKAGTIQSMTDLDKIRKKLDQGIQIGKVYYTAGYGFSTSEFSTADPEEIAQLWQAVNTITVGERTNESVTDWYPQIVFYLTDGTSGAVNFEGPWLNTGGTENYEISNADAFWDLTASLVEKHEEIKRGAVPAGRIEPVDGGWETAEDPAVTDEIRALFDQALKGLVGVHYVPVAYLGRQVVAGYNHAILCQATTVYPGAVPRWAIVYLYEAPDGNVAISDIRNLEW